MNLFKKDRRMTHFSSKKAIEFSFSTYRKHFVLLTTASALMAASLWLCTGSVERIAQQSGISQALDIAAIGKEQGHPATVWSVIAQVGANLKTVPGHYYIALLLVVLLGYALFFFLALGFMNLCLTLKDTGHGSLKLLFSLRFAQVKRFAGGAALYFLSLCIGFVGAGLFSALVGMMCRFFLSVKMTIPVTTVVCVCLLAATFVWVMGYMFFGFCILDKPHISSLEALQMSAALSKGFRGRMVKTLFLTFLVVMVPLMVLLTAVLIMGKILSLGDYTSAALLNSMSILITYPLFFLCCSYLYRSLQSK